MMTTAIHAAKRLLRKELRAKLATMTEEQKAHQSKIVTDKVLTLRQYKEAQSIALYLSMPSEINTYELLQNAFQDNKKCFIPHYNADSMKMVLLKDMQDFDNLPVTSWNIKQPSDEEERENAIDSGGLDLVLVPGLGFTENGLRLGRGKGYYDRYLKKYRKEMGRTPFLVGLSFQDQLCSQIPTTEDDYPLDLVLFP